jgi:hypothetical protein
MFKLSTVQLEENTIHDANLANAVIQFLAFLQFLVLLGSDTQVRSIRLAQAPFVQSLVLVVQCLFSFRELRRLETVFHLDSRFPPLLYYCRLLILNCVNLIHFGFASLRLTSVLFHLSFEGVHSTFNPSKRFQDLSAVCWTLLMVCYLTHFTKNFGDTVHHPECFVTHLKKVPNESFYLLLQ